MSARFAGSLELAQRRRRRLAQEADGVPIASGTPRASRVSQSSSAAGESGRVSPYSGPRLPRDTMIPGSWAVIAALGVLGISIWGVILWLGLSSFAEQMGIGQLASLTEGAIPRYFSTVALLLTAQLSLLIYWHRSRSRKDFLGRYRVWGWAGLFWCLICLAQATQCHHALLHWLHARYVVECWRGEHLCWFLPLATCLLALYRLIGRDINPSRASSFAWNTAFCLGLLVAGMYFGLDLLFPPAWRGTATVAVSMLWQYSLALFCLIHARYVTHVSNEVGGKRISLRSRISRWLTARLSQLGEWILAVRPWRLFPRRINSEGETPTLEPRRRKSTRSREAAQAPSSEGFPEKGKAREPLTASAQPAQRESRKTDQNGLENSDFSVRSGRPAWGSRIRQIFAGMRLRMLVKQGDSLASLVPDRENRREKVVQDTGERPTDQRPAVQPRSKVKDVREPREKAAAAGPQESGPSWGERLKGSLLSRWRGRVDAPQAVGEQSGPHMTPEPAAPKAAPKVAAVSVPEVKQEKPVEVPKVSATAVVRPTEKPEPPARPKSSPRPVSRYEMDEEEDDDDDDDSGRMSRKDRKRQKKRERQRD